MNYFTRLFLGLVLTLSVLCPPFAALASHEEDGSSWNSRQAYDQETANRRAQAQAQAREEEQAANRRSQERMKAWTTLAPAPSRPDNGLDYTNSYNSSSGVFTNCYGSGNTRTCTSTGGR